MDYGWYDLVGNLGVACVLGCYFFAQTGRMDISRPAYSLWNGAGALLILVSLLYNFNLSSFIIEIAWLLISAYGLLRWHRTRVSQTRDRSPH